MQYQIGDFSRISSLSVKTLRFYHDKGILIPTVVDEESGYRYYDERLLSQARAIRVLRDLEFSINEIKEIVDSCEDDSDLVEFLIAKSMEIGEKIQRYQSIEKRLKTVIKQEEESKMVNQSNEVTEKRLDDMLIASMRVKTTYSESGKLFGKIYRACGRHAAGRLFNMYWDKGYVEGDADIEICLPVKKVVEKDGITSRILKGGRTLSVIHKGPYGTQGPAYKALIDYIEKNKLKCAQPPREIYIKGPGMIFKGNPNNYITEIQMVVEEGD
ncbi:MAG: MerR family transcriptional regulator [Planctomycetes bacterium]|nr:MerR family transcriptional regulator [Planctomycetota bacterium]